MSHINFDPSQITAIPGYLQKQPYGNVLKMGLGVVTSVCFQEILQMGFNCPCSSYNDAYGVLYLTCPGLAIGFLVSMIMQDKWKCDLTSCLKCCLHFVTKILIALLVWYMVVFLDGDTWACKRSQAPHKGCGPNCTCSELVVCKFKEGSATEGEKHCYHYLIFRSKTVGLLLLVILAICAFLFGWICSCLKACMPHVYSALNDDETADQDEEAGAAAPEAITVAEDVGDREALLPARATSVQQTSAHR